LIKPTYFSMQGERCVA